MPYVGVRMRDDKLPDRRAIERHIAGLQKIMKLKNFTTTEEAQEYIHGFKGQPVPELEGPRTLSEMAQEMVFKAYEKSDTKERIELAHKALHVYQDCAGAYILLAEEEASNEQEALENYLKAEESGKRSLGEAFIKANRGKLWDIIEARPYLRALEGVANGFWRQGKKNEAVKKCREILSLNSKDNQGIRYTLVTYLTEQQKFRELDAFMNSNVFNGDNDIEWFYTKPLASFAVSGDTAVARKNAETAVDRNMHVVKYMAGYAKLPEQLPEKYAPHSEEEAVVYVANNLASWLMIPDAFDWFIDTANKLFAKRADAGPEAAQNSPEQGEGKLEQ